MLQVNRQGNRIWIASLMLLMILVACSAPVPVAPAAATTESTAEAAIEATAVPAEAAAMPEAPAEEVTTEATEEITEEASAEATEAPMEEAAGTTGSMTFVIDSAQSEARFTLTEVLMGSLTTVTGRGNGVEGEITVNFDEYSQSTVSPIIIDASLLATDNNMRNGQIRRAVLRTNQAEYQYITFTPTSIEGYPSTDAVVGEPFMLTVNGDLTIVDSTMPASFEVTVTPVSETEIQGRAATTILRNDFDLQIPSVPSVANVSEEVLLEFDFVAVAQ
jgi:polyisoprenoid-binding protein YceI